MVGCDLSARLPGFGSSILRVKKPLERGQNDLGTIVMYPLERVKGSTVSATSLLAPKKARKALDRARKAVEKEKFDEAEEAFNSAVLAYPKYGEAWFELGQLYRQTQRDTDARDAYLKAIGCDEVFVQPYVGLSWISALEKKWEETADLANKVIELDPINFPEAHFLSALSNHYLDNLDLAEKSARQLQRIDPEHKYPKVFLVLSNIYAKKSDEMSSIEELRNYLRHAPDAEDAEAIRSLLEEKLAKADDNKPFIDFPD
jgi:tetratricopeptide (TPR) repeat protein